MLADPTPNQRNGAALWRELAPEPGVREGLVPSPGLPLGGGGVGPRKPLEVLMEVLADTLGSPSTHT